MSIFSKLAGPGPDIEAHDVVTRAMHSSGAATFGSDEWSTPLEVLTRSVNTEAELHREGRKAARDFLVRILEGRFESIAPVSGAAESAAPLHTATPPTIVVLGTYGSGAHHLARALRSARKTLGEPTPVPSVVETRLFLQQFTSFEFERRWHVPAYSEWLADADLTDSYRSAAARLFASAIHDVEATATGASAPLILQGEHHLEHLDLLHEAFPEALLVHVHRDPSDCLHESIDKVVSAREIESDAVDSDKVSKYWNWRTGLLLDRYVAQREAWVQSDAPGAATVIDLSTRAVSLDLATVAAGLLALAHGGDSVSGRTTLQSFELNPTSLREEHGLLPNADRQTDGFEHYRSWINENFA